LAAVYLPIERQSRSRLIVISFLNILRRDLWVNVRDWKSFLATTLIQPILLLFVFGRVLGALGQTREGFSLIILPGVVAMTILLTSLTIVTLPLAMEFGFTKEIEDRLLSPLPIWCVAIEKLVYACIRGVVGGVLLVPLGTVILGSDFHANTDHLGFFALVAVLGSLTAAAVGLTLGTYIEPQKMGLMIPLILPPLFFTGCVYYPWLQLFRLRWFQVITCFTPLTYLSEGIRASLAPQVPHMPVGYILLGESVFLLIFGYLGLRGFQRKAVD
jgi:ABC-2 type transport system permease protein